MIQTLPRELLFELPEDYAAEVHMFSPRKVMLKGRRIKRPSATFLPNTASEQWHGLTAWWPTIQADHSTVLREMIGGNNGTLTDMDTPDDWVSAESLGGHVLDFDGVDDNVVTTSDITFAATDSFSVSLWLMTRSVTGGTIEAVNRTLAISTIIEIRRDDADLHFRIRGDNGAGITDSGAQIIAANTWYHAVGVRDVGADTINLYLNGVGGTPVADATTSGFTQTFKFGAHSDAGLYWNGQLADIRIYNRALSAAEVFRLYDPMTRWELYL